MKGSIDSILTESIVVHTATNQTKFVCNQHYTKPYFSNIIEIENLER